jgi:hypothetical protein
VQEYTRRKAAGEFEVRRPRTTKEIAVHNNQLLQDLPGQMMQAMLQAQQGQGAAAWSDAVRERPAAPRPTAEEQEAEAEAQQQHLLRRMEELQKSGAGKLAALQYWQRGMTNTGSYWQAYERLRCGCYMYMPTTCLHLCKLCTFCRQPHPQCGQELQHKVGSKGGSSSSTSGSSCIELVSNRHSCCTKCYSHKLGWV